MGQGAGRFPTASAVLRDLSCVLLGQRAMLSPACKEDRADNTQLRQLYYVRLPAGLAEKLPAESVEAEGETAHVITKAMSPAEMHDLAKEWRAEGGSLFFAAIGG